MSKKVITPDAIEVKELEQKIAPYYFSNILVGSLFSGVDSYTVGDNSWHWDDTASRMGSYMGNNYDPMSLIGGSNSVSSSANVVTNSLYSGLDSYTGGDNSWHWGDTASRMGSYLGSNYNPMGIINNNYWLQSKPVQNI